jgi:hypothetical protein
MLISFVLLLVTSSILYIIPHGRVAYWSDWHLLGLSKTQWGNLHINLGILFILAGILHLFYNWSAVLSYMKNRVKKVKIFTADFNVALVLSLVIAAGTLLDLPPMSTVISFSESIKNNASKKYGEPPYGHAELSSLKLFAKKTNLDPEKAKQLLKAAGILGAEEKVTLGHLAKINHTTPKALYAIMKSAEIKPQADVSFPDSPPSGLGHKTLAEICAAYEIDLPSIIRRLDAKGITADPALSLKEIARGNNTDPYALFEVLHDLVSDK